MPKAENISLTPQWMEIKQMFEANTNGCKEYGKNFPLDGELDELTQHFVGKIALITLDKGFDAMIEGVKLDLWKERIWSLIENAGLLPEVSEEDYVFIDKVVEETWHQPDSEFDIDIEELEKQAIEDLSK